MQRTTSAAKTLMLGKIEDKRKGERQRIRWLDSITNSLDMNLSKLWEIAEEEEPDVLPSMRSQTVRYDLVTEQQQNSWFTIVLCCVSFTCTARWFSYAFTHISSFSDSFLISGSASPPTLLFVFKVVLAVPGPLPASFYKIEIVFVLGLFWICWSVLEELISWWYWDFWSMNMYFSIHRSFIEFFEAVFVVFSVYFLYIF